MPRKHEPYPETSNMVPNEYLGKRILSISPWKKRKITEIETEFWDDNDSVAGWWITWEDK